MAENEIYVLGTVVASERLISDLYIELRRKINKWASITHQTAQARMGYVGQHLVSVVTGFPGGRSGARGKDLLHGDGRFSEIKTCYRVDQLGKCNSCGTATASIEEVCPSCGETDIKRNDDSKWLIGIRHDEEFADILTPTYYYLVLFDFTDLQVPDTIRASIWRIDSLAPGFAYCMIDYYLNIRTSSESKAPFNLWPYSLKFGLMKPCLIYRSIITADDKIETQIVPGRDVETLHSIKPLQQYAQSRTLTKDKVIALARSLNIKVNKSKPKRDIIIALQNAVDEKGMSDVDFADALAKAIYLPEIQEHIEDLPHSLKDRIMVL
jgi:predicted RNA-binding Zn-ribbon protein involved in translation (DUF1610 family)